MSIIERIKNIILNPKGEWEVIKTEQISNRELMVKYALVLAAIPALSGFIGKFVFGISMPFGSAIRVSLYHNLLWAVLTYILSIAAIFVLAFIIDALAPSFGSTKNFNASLKVVVYAYTASWISGIFGLIPFLSILSVLGLYSLYLLWWGLKIVKDVPQDKMVGYYLISILIAIIVYIIIGTMVSAMALSSYYFG